MALGLLTVMLVPAVGMAQRAGNNGVKVGEGRLHPYFDLDLAFDSAAGFFGPPGTTALSSEAITRFRPGLRLEIPSPNVALNLNGNLEYVLYTGLLSAGSTAASHFESAVDFDIAVNRAGAVEFDLADHLTRSDRTTNAAIGVGVLSFFNELRAALPIHPGGGALEVTPRAAWALEIFQPWSTLAVPGCTDASCTAAALQGMNYNNFRFELGARWRFLPKTAVVFDSSFDTRAYSNPGSNPTPLLLRATLGLAGLVSPKVSAVAKVGWGHDFGAVSAKTVIGHLEVAYLMSETSNFRLGYLRTLDPVPTYGINGDDRGYFEGRMLLGGKLTLRAYSAVDFLTFYGPSPRSDVNLTIDAGPDYQFTPWLIGSLGYTMGLRVSSQTAQSVNFARHQGYLRVEFTY